MPLEASKKWSKIDLNLLAIMVESPPIHKVSSTNCEEFIILISLAN